MSLQQNQQKIQKRAIHNNLNLHLKPLHFTEVLTDFKVDPNV